MTTYTTIWDVIDYEVTPALGDFADCYDREAIARECWEYDEERRGFTEREGVDFWEVAARHDLVGDDVAEAWRGDGFYFVGYSDERTPWTSEGPVWVETRDDLARLIGGAYRSATDTHIPVVDYVGLEL